MKSDEGSSSINDVVDWMIEKSSSDCLYQDDAASEIEKIFGKEFLYDNKNGNPAISKEVLKQFRKQSGDDIVWSRSERHWRKRIKTDSKGRMQE